MTPLLALAFPSGRLPSRFDRRFVGFVYAFFLVSQGLRMMVWDPQSTDLPR